MFARHSLVSILDLGPIDACIQLSTQLPLMTVQELHAELPYVIRRIFGFGRFDWSLRDIGNDRANLFSIIQEFLSPWHGQLWKALLRLQDHTPQFTFQFNISDLPIHLRAKLASLCLPDIVRGRTTTTGQHLTSLALDPIEYFLFHLLSYVVSDQHSSDRPMRSDSVYLNILEMYLCLFLPIDADEFRLLLMPTSNTTTSTAFTTSHVVDPRLSPPVPVETMPKKSPVRQSYLFGSNVKQRGEGEGNSMNLSTSPTSPLLPSSPPAVLSTTTADTNELMKKIDYFIKCYVAFLIDVFQPSKSVFGTNSGSILVQEFNLSDVQLLCIRMFIKRLHLFCSYQIGGVGGNNASLANTGMTLLEQRNLLVPLQTLKRTCIDTYVRQPLYTLLQIGIVRCPLDQRYNTLLFVWYTYIRPWRFSPQTISNDHKATNLLDTTNIDQDTSPQDQSIINTETINFVERNLPFYGRLFQFAVDRLQKTDLTNTLIAQLINKLANVFSAKNFSSLLLKAEQVAMYSFSAPYSSGKQRISPPSSPDGPRPTYSILCDETRTIMLGCLRKISSVIQKNERRIEERHRLAEQEKQKSSQAAQIVSTNARELFGRILLKIPYLKPSQSTTKTSQLKPELPPEIVEQLTNTKNKFIELFQIDSHTFDTTTNDDEPSLTHPLDTSFQTNKSLSTSITESRLNASYSPYELENPILSPPNPFELRPLLWFNRQLSENINLRYADQINSLYNLQGFPGAFFRQLFYGPNDQRFHSILQNELSRLNSSSTTYPWVKQVHVVSMTHLDVGFTNFAANVCSLYFNEHLPNAARLAQELHDRGGDERFIFTTHPWILLEFFDNIAQCTNERPNSTTINLVEKAIKQGDITWHAHAFSMFIPMMDKNLFNISLSISSILDDRFYQKRKTSASHKDDMGHPISSIPIFAENGIKSIHIGANLNCHGADLPPAFVWKHEETETELLVMMYNKPTASTPCSAESCIYGGDVVLPGFNQAMIYHFTLDNTGPPHNITDVIRVWSEIKTHYPNAEIIASNLETFSQSLFESYKDQLPVITDEWGTTWLYGVAADPYKQSAYRQISRLLLNEKYSSALFNYSFRLLKNPEHNWGLCTGCYLKEENYAHNYHNEEFSRVRNGSDFQLLEQGWKEARSYLYPLNSSDPSLIKLVENTLEELQPSRPDITHFIPIPLPINRTKDYFLFETTLFSVGFNYTSGAIVFLQDGQGRNLSTINNTLGSIQYKTYSNEDFNRFNLQFNPNCGPPCGDFAKPGLTNSQSQTSFPYVISMWRDEINQTVLVELTFPNEIIEEYGGSQTLWLNYTFPLNSPPIILIELEWFNKTATRLPESIWIEFNPILPVRSNSCNQWRIDVLGYDVDPSNIVEYGSRRLHAIGHDGVRFYEETNARSLFALYSLDAPLLSIGSSDYLLNFDNSIPDCQGIDKNGLFINLHNNLWNTAFPIYYEQDAKFRFKIEFLPEWMQIIDRK